MSAYDPTNIFARMLRDEIPSHRVFENAAALVVLDRFPQSRGHTLIIPKVPSRNLLDADPETLKAVLPLVQRVARAVIAVTGADGLRLAQFNEAAAGQTVFHLQFHLIPVYLGADVARHGGGEADDAALVGLARDIAARL